jgi:hypothetical protein
MIHVGYGFGQALRTYCPVRCKYLTMKIMHQFTQTRLKKGILYSVCSFLKVWNRISTFLNRAPQPHFDLPGKIFVAKMVPPTFLVNKDHYRSTRCDRMFHASREYECRLRYSSQFAWFMPNAQDDGVVENGSWETTGMERRCKGMPNNHWYLLKELISIECYHLSSHTTLIYWRMPFGS